MAVALAKPGGKAVLGPGKRGIGLRLARGASKVVKTKLDEPLDEAPRSRRTT